MKKKLLSILLAVVLVFGMMTFAGCGKKEMVFYSSPSEKLVLNDNEFELLKANISTTKYVQERGRYNAFLFAEMKIISKNFGNGTYSFELTPETECLI